VTSQQEVKKNTDAAELAYLGLGSLDRGHVFRVDVVGVEIKLPAWKSATVLVAKLQPLLLALCVAASLLLV
jgi:hypothetical protein